MICNACNIITHVNALWPGSCHDDSIFKGSSIYNYLNIFTNPPPPEEVPRSYKIIHEVGEFVRQCLIKEILVHGKNSSILNNTFTYFQEILIVSFLFSNQFSELEVPFASHEGQSPFFHGLLLI